MEGHEEDEEHLSHEEKMRELGLFRVKNTWLREDLLSAYQYLKSGGHETELSSS